MMNHNFWLIQIVPQQPPIFEVFEGQMINGSLNEHQRPINITIKQRPKSARVCLSHKINTKRF